MTSKAIEKSLVAALKNGDTLAFDELFSLYGKKIYRFAYSYLKNKEDAEEIVQEVFLRVWGNRQKVNEYLSFQSFLFTISYNIIIDCFRARMKDKTFKDILLKKIDLVDTTTENEIAFNELDERYKKAVDLLPPRRKEIYLMSAEGLSYNDIAQNLNISPNTVENQMVAAHKFLRETLGKSSLMSLLFFYLYVL